MLWCYYGSWPVFWFVNLQHSICPISWLLICSQQREIVLTGLMSQRTVSHQSSILKTFSIPFSNYIATYDDDSPFSVNSINFKRNSWVLRWLILTYISKDTSIPNFIWEHFRRHLEKGGGNKNRCKDTKEKLPTMFRWVTAC